MAVKYKFNEAGLMEEKELEYNGGDMCGCTHSRDGSIAFTCTLDLGHEGQHEAWGSVPLVYWMEPVIDEQMHMEFFDPSQGRSTGVFIQLDGEILTYPQMLEKFGHFIQKECFDSFFGGGLAESLKDSQMYPCWNWRL
jgi:hypothetical protein